MSKIVCDECGWSRDGVEFIDLASWHHKPCPSCGRGEIINDADMEVLADLQELMDAKLITALSSDAPDDPVTVRINTAPLRGNK